MPNLARHDLPRLTEVREYSGEEALAISCTQLGTRYSATQAKKIVSDWADFFAAGPTPIRDLQFTTRTPRRLFASLRGQTQLRRLSVKWGDYDDLSVLTGCSALRELTLRGASSVTSVQALEGLTGLRSLEIEGLKRARDMSGLGQLTNLTRLELGGDWKSPRIAHVDSIGFLRNLMELEGLLLHTIIADDLDYSPLLDLPRLRAVRVMKARGMTPSFEHLRSVLPWSG
jgi:hypothetical protein